MLVVWNCPNTWVFYTQLETLYHNVLSSKTAYAKLIFPLPASQCYFFVLIQDIQAAVSGHSLPLGRRYCSARQTPGKGINSPRFHGCSGPGKLFLMLSHSLPLSCINSSLQKPLRLCLLLLKMSCYQNQHLVSLIASMLAH